jgi:hypothetical protein
MKRSTTAVLMAGLILAIPRVASAQAKQGDKEIEIGGNVASLFATGSGTSTFGQFNFGIGFFVTDRFEFAVAPTVQITATAVPAQPGTPAIIVGGRVIVPAVAATPASTNWNTDGGFSTKAQFFFGAKASKVKPYLGAAFVIQSFKTPAGGSFADNTYAAALFGLRSYLSERTAVDFNGQFGFQTSHPADGQILQINVGITYLF